ncbi:MAG: molecular chaperone DnaJ [Spirochaetae bacterium HGW-Spirochaetae-3]|jgi:molecular chaperone DnaJ|nr:MAG: molecular chaperone DnaJ [Spirochaetae bacterium HGW-Spirochaetae-3]
MISDPYRVLGVSSDATEDELAKAYRRLAKVNHPDVNHGNPEAAKKMSDINAAYEQIKRGDVPQGGGGAYAGQGPGGRAAGTAGSSDPFGFGFDPFDLFSSFAGGQQRTQRPLGFDQVRMFINAGYPGEALKALSAISDKSAEWYYYSAIANSYAGNAITALQHARAAVQMEPGNPEYARALDQIENGGSAYQRQSRAYGMPRVDVSRLCLGVILTNLFCMFCGRPF